MAASTAEQVWADEQSGKALRLLIQATLAARPGVLSGSRLIDALHQAPASRSGMPVTPPIQIQDESGELRRAKKSTIVGVFGEDNEVSTIALKEFLKRRGSVLMRGVCGGKLLPLSLFHWQEAAAEPINLDEVASRTGYSAALLAGLTAKGALDDPDFQRVVRGRLMPLSEAAARSHLTGLHGDVRLVAVGHGRDVNNEKGESDYRVFGLIPAEVLARYLSANLLSFLNLDNIERLHVNFLCCALIPLGERIDHKKSYLRQFLVAMQAAAPFSASDSSPPKKASPSLSASTYRHKVGYFPDDFVKQRMVSLGGEDYVYDKDQLKAARWERKVRVEWSDRGVTQSLHRPDSVATQLTELERQYLSQFDTARKALREHGGLKSADLSGERDLMFCLCTNARYRLTDENDTALLIQFLKGLDLPGCSTIDSGALIRSIAVEQGQATLHWAASAHPSTHVDFGEIAFRLGIAQQKLCFSDDYGKDLTPRQHDTMRLHHLRTKALESRIFCWRRAPEEPFDLAFIDRFLSTTPDCGMDVKTLKSIWELARASDKDPHVATLKTILQAGVSGRADRGSSLFDSAARLCKPGDLWTVNIDATDAGALLVLSQADSVALSSALAALIQDAYEQAKPLLEGEGEGESHVDGMGAIRVKLLETALRDGSAEVSAAERLASADPDLSGDWFHCLAKSIGQYAATSHGEGLEAHTEIAPLVTRQVSRLPEPEICRSTMA